MAHEHIRIVVSDAATPGAESVPAERTDDGFWRLLHSPLYATEVAAGDVVNILDPEAGRFEIVRRGGKISVQFYLAEHEANDCKATAAVAEEVESELATVGGQVDGRTHGLIAFSIPVAAGFTFIENLFERTVRRHPGAEWQYGNVYDPVTGEPLRWWE